MLPDLDVLLNYHHEKVIKSYIRTFNADEKKASLLFSDALRFLWLSRKHMHDRKQHPEDEALNFQFFMHEEMRDMDNMWHNFILYTNDYTDFCLHHFGEYLHHIPDVAETMTQTVDDFSTDLNKYLSYAYDHLGEETVRRWFSMHLMNNAESHGA